MMMIKFRKINGISRFFAIFKSVLLIIIFTSQFTFSPLPLDAAHSKLNGIYSGANSAIEIRNKSQQYIAQLDPLSLVITISDFIGLGRSTSSKVNEVIKTTGAEARETLREFTNNLKDFISTLSKAYQDNLDITINSLDEFTRKKIEEVIFAIEKVNKQIQQDIKLVSHESQQLIRTTSKEIQQVTKQLEESLKNVIVVTSEATVYILDRLTWNSIIFLSFGMLGAGILFFIWILFMKQLPDGIAKNLVLLFFATYISIFGSMAFLPKVRTYAMVNSGIGLKERLSTHQKIDGASRFRIRHRLYRGYCLKASLFTSDIDDPVEMSQECAVPSSIWRWDGKQLRNQSVRYKQYCLISLGNYKASETPVVLGVCGQKNSFWEISGFEKDKIKNALHPGFLQVTPLRINTISLGYIVMMDYAPSCRDLSKISVEYQDRYSRSCQSTSGWYIDKIETTE
jgi:gas vesicle protein